MLLEKERFHMREEIEKKSEVTDYKENDGCTIDDIHSVDNDDGDDLQTEMVESMGSCLSFIVRRGPRAYSVRR